MKMHVALSVLASSALLHAGPPEKARDPAPQPPPPVYAAPIPPPPSATTVVPEQRQYGGQLAPLVQPQRAQAVVDRFKETYAKLEQPRILIYVNRDLVDENSGLKLSARTEKTTSSRTANRSETTVNVVGASPSGPTNVPPQGAVEHQQIQNENRYRLTDRPAFDLTDRQTVREIQQVFGRPLRQGGAALVDQRVATQLIGDRPLASFTVQTEGESARKDREALSKLVDVVVEVLIDARNVTLSSWSGDQTYAIPDIQTTAVRLRDSRILGQASSADVIGKNPAPSVIQNYGAPEIAEATALALMEDISSGQK